MPKTTDKNKYFVVKERAVPEVLLNVVAAKKLLESKRAATVQEAADAVGISRSSFYKYKDAVFSFDQDQSRRNAVVSMIIKNEKGALSKVLSLVSVKQVNVLAINQTIPINGIHNLSLTLDITDLEISIQALLKLMEAMPMVDKAELVAVE